MKNIIKLSLVILLVCTPILTYSQIAKAEIRAMGLTCSMCSNSIQKSLKALPNVTKVTTDLNTNTFTVFLDNPNTITPKVLKNSVEKAGFSVGVMTLDISKNDLNSKSYVIVDKNKVTSKNFNTIQVLNEGYVTNKEFKKLKKTYKSLDTGFKNETIYQIKLIN